MKVTDYQTDLIQANVWPHDGKGPHGPHDIRISFKTVPSIVEEWAKGRPVGLSVDQPNDDDNFTLFRVLFRKGGTPSPSMVTGVSFRNCKCYKKGGKKLKVSVKVRYTNSLPHPVPTGPYQGTVLYDSNDTFALLTMQAGTLRKEPEPSKPKIIVTPEDPGFHESLSRIKRIIH